MKKVKQKLLILMITLTIILVIILIPKDSNEELDDVNEEEKSGFLTFMIEDGYGNYKEASDNTWPTSDTYIFNNKLSTCINGSKLKYNESDKTVNVTTNKPDKCYVYFDQYELTNYILKNYKQDGDNNIYYHDGKGSYTNSNLEAGDESYRFSGTNNAVNNYVCFGSKNCSSTTTNSNYQYLYRIIGLFKNEEGNYETKLIKADYSTGDDLGRSGSYFKIGVYKGDEFYTGDKVNYYPKVVSYYWNYKSNNQDLSVNDWNLSDLYKVNLNGNFLDTYLKKKDDVEWKDLIATHNWITAGNLEEKLLNAGSVEKVYDYEIKNPSVGEKLPNATTSVDAKVGLLYISDYYYGTIPNNWTSLEDYEAIKTNNWLYVGLCEWVITRNSSGNTNVYYIYNDGRVVGSINSDANAVRPVFYLKDTVKIVSGNGSKTSPYIIN